MQNSPKARCNAGLYEGNIQLLGLLFLLLFFYSFTTVKEVNIEQKPVEQLI